MGGLSGAKTVSASYATAQTNMLLAAAPGTGKKIVLQWVVASQGAGAGELRLLNGPIVSAAITASSQASPTVITCGAYVPTGATVVISGDNTATPTINGTYTATNVSAVAFSIPLAVTVAGTNGTATCSGAIAFAALLAINTPVVFDGSPSPIVLTEATPLCFTSVTGTTARVNVGYTVEAT